MLATSMADGVKSIHNNKGLNTNHLISCNARKYYHRCLIYIITMNTIYGLLFSMLVKRMN